MMFSAVLRKYNSIFFPPSSPTKITLQQRLFRYKLCHSVLFQIQLRSPCKHHPVLKLVSAQEAVIIHSHFIVDFLFQDFHGFFS